MSKLRAAPLILTIAATFACAPATPAPATTTPATTTTTANGPSASSASASSRAPLPSASASSSADVSAGARLVTSPCVLHAGSGRGSRPKDGGERHASCDFGAECIAAHGVATPGDGFVGVACVDTDCYCEWMKPLSDDPLREQFSIDELPKGTETCKRLLIHRCMKGMRLVEPGGR